MNRLVIVSSRARQADNVVKKVGFKEALKSSIFVVQKAAASKIGVEFRQGSIGTIRSGLATSCDVAQRRALAR